MKSTFQVIQVLWKVHLTHKKTEDSKAYCNIAVCIFRPSCFESDNEHLARSSYCHAILFSSFGLHTSLSLTRDGLFHRCHIWLLTVAAKKRNACSNRLLKHEKRFVTDLNRPEPPERTQLAQALPVNGLCVCRQLRAVVVLALTWHTSLCHSA